MNKILVTHLNNHTGSTVGKPFIADFDLYKHSNKKNDKFDWDAALTAFVNGKSYTTINMPYNNIKLELVKQ